MLAHGRQHLVEVIPEKPVREVRRFIHIGTGHGQNQDTARLYSKNGIHMSLGCLIQIDIFGMSPG